MAFQNGEDEICLSTLGRTYTIDLTVMKQINEDIGMARNIFRRVNAHTAEGKSPTCCSRFVDQSEGETTLLITNQVESFPKLSKMVCGGEGGE